MTEVERLEIEYLAEEMKVGQARIDHDIALLNTMELTFLAAIGAYTLPCYNYEPTASS